MGQSRSKWRPSYRILAIGQSVSMAHGTPQYGVLSSGPAPGKKKHTGAQHNSSECLALLPCSINFAVLNQ
jgi:hypothetical protein